MSNKYKLRGIVMADTINNNQIMNEKIANACRIFEASLTAIKEIFDKTRKYGTPTVRDFTFRADNIEDIKKCANAIESAFDIMYDCIAVLGFYSLCKDDKDKFVKFCKSSLDNMLNKKSYELSGLIVYETTIAAAIACYCVTEAAITAECDIVKDKYQYRGDYDDGNITWNLSSELKKVSVKSTDSEIQQDYSVSLQYDDAIIKKWAEEHNKPASKMDIKNDWKLEERSDGAICLKKYKGNDKIVNIPDNVTIIADRAFLDCNDITNVTIPDSITSIERYAFSGCTSLTNITIPDSVISIGDAAFCSCTGLTNITLNNGINSIGEYTFSGCTGLTKIDIPASVTTIGYSAFDKCTGLKNIAIPDSVTSIGECAFYGCRSLTNITIPDGVISIKKSMFYNCTELTSITIPNSVSLIEECAFYGCQGLTNIILPQNITSIGNSMFECCTSLAKIILPDSVTSIGEFAFCGCSGMTSITIPTSVNKIENLAFCGCSKLTIYAPAGSYAEKYAKSNNIPYEAI